MSTQEPAVRAVPVADLLRTRRRGWAYPRAGYLNAIEVGAAWPSVWDQLAVAGANDVPILALDRALDRLQIIDAELARIIELRAFGGLTIEQAALVLKVSPSTAKRDWRTAKAWLTRELADAARP